ncbi:hypothetical protein BDV59DRAFT_87706 [Aspergillus ambiguus]|uniref:uncharacterized protein n=1 Tax=Aspergillus ambiguus TaxID=176160 RepID=UPI003CCE3A15
MLTNPMHLFFLCYISTILSHVKPRLSMEPFYHSSMICIPQKHISPWYYISKLLYMKRDYSINEVQETSPKWKSHRNTWSIRISNRRAIETYKNITQ